MKVLIYALVLLLTIVVICSPLYMVYAGFVLFNDHFEVKCLLIVVGLILCRIIKPLSTITGKDLKVF